MDIPFIEKQSVQNPLTFAAMRSFIFSSIYPRDSISSPLFLILYSSSTCSSILFSPVVISAYFQFCFQIILTDCERSCFDCEIDPSVDRWIWYQLNGIVNDPVRLRLPIQLLQQCIVPFQFQQLSVYLQEYSVGLLLQIE